MAWLGNADAAGYINEEWITKQYTKFSDDECRTMLNPYLKPVESFDLSQQHVPMGVFVPCHATERDAGGLEYMPSFNTMGGFVQDDDKLETLHAATLYQRESIWTKFALVGVSTTANFPVDLFHTKDARYHIINTGAESLHAGDVFVVRPPSAEDSVSQIHGYKNSYRAKQCLGEQNALVGGYAATSLVPGDMFDRVKHVIQRDVTLCVDYVTAANTVGPVANVNPALLKLFDSNTDLGKNVKSTVFTSTVDVLDSFAVLLEMISRLRRLSQVSVQLINEYVNYKNGINATIDASTLINIWKDPVIADLFFDGLDFGFNTLRKLRFATWGHVIRFNEANPAPIDSETIYNPYSGQYFPGELMIGVVSSFNGM